MGYDALKLSSQLCFPLYAASKGLVSKYTPILKKIDLTYTQYISMLALWEHEQLTSKQLGNLLYLDSGTLTPVLKSLEGKGYVKRERSKDDERILNVSLTEVGKRLKDAAVGIPAEIAACLNLKEDEAIQLYTILHKILNGFEGEVEQ